MHLRRFLACTTLLVALGAVSAQAPLRSGLPPGVRPGPYSALVCTGPQRGQAYCYICETGDHPAVVVLDDLHWATETLLETVQELVETMGPVPMVLVFQGRPELVERMAGLTPSDRATILTLGAD